METNCAPLIDDSFSVVVMNPNLKLIKSTDFFSSHCDALEFNTYEYYFNDGRDTI